MERSSREPPREFLRAWRIPGLVFGAAATVRASLAIAFPTIHGGDASARLAHAGTLVLGYQLPLPQAFVSLGRLMSDDPLSVRLLFCLWGGFLAAGVSALLEANVGRSAALFAGGLLAFDPLLIHYSIVPYQEPLAYGFVAWALVASGRDRPWVAALLLAAATLSRYEAWLFAPLVAMRLRNRAAGIAAVLPVLVWIAWWRGLAPGGLYVLDIDLAASRWPRLTFLGEKFLEYETAAPLALGLAGVLVLAIRRRGTALAFVAWVLGAIGVIVAFGHEFPPGTGLMSERLIHLPVLLFTALAAVTLARLAEASRLSRAMCLLFVGALAARDLRFEARLLRAASREPDLALARDAAREIERFRRPGECVSIEAPRVDPALLRSYVAKVGASWGDVATATARAAASTDASPDRDRIAAHLIAPPGTVRAARGCPLLVVVDSGRGERGGEGAGVRIAEVSAGPRRAGLYRTRD